MARLENVRNSGKTYSKALYYPTPDELDALKVGDIVKLIFQVEESAVDGGGMPSGERMWVKIIMASGEDFAGTLMNMPAVIEDLKCGDKVSFKNIHIAEIYNES